MRSRNTVLLLVLLLAAASPPRSAIGQQDSPGWAAPPIERAVSVRDGRTGETIRFTAMLDALATADVVFLGETHNDETTHRVEWKVYDGLLKRKQKQVVLAMEMFERDVQPQLDDYLAGRVDEASFLEKSRPWGNYRTAYRPLIERARQAGKPVIASNFPRPLRMRVATQGAQVLEKLEENELAQAPKEYHPNTDAYWRRVDNAVRGHLDMMRRGGDSSRLYSTQSLWDNSMGAACAEALEKHPGHLVLHVNGGFHSAYWDGTVHQLKTRKPNTKIKTVSIVPATNPKSVRLEGQPVADYVVLAEARATDLNDGTWSVYGQTEIKYQLHMPDAATADQPVPLLIWLSDDGFTASDGLDLWKDRLGRQVAIAVVESPYRETQADFGVGGRWFWPDSFSSDTGGMVVAVERIWAYIMRHYPIDPQRVCVAGEGAGATVVSTVALLSDRLDMHAVAVRPSQYSKIKDFPLPLPELRGDEPARDKALRVIGTPEDESWWSSELEQYNKIGLIARMVTQTDDPWQRERQEENAIREALGLATTAATPSPKRRYMLVESDSPRARHWARLQAIRATNETGEPVATVSSPPKTASASQLSLQMRPQMFTKEGMLPRCPGPFGGTTVLVLPKDATEREIRAWTAVEQDDPLSKASRFHRMRIARMEGQPGLIEVLEKLKAAGRKNILIVPATFCADADWMRTLKTRVRGLENSMTFHWLPGLGGSELPLGSPDEASADTPANYKLTVRLTPGSHQLHVRCRIELPDSLCDVGTEFVLHGDLKIQSSSPSVEKVEGAKEGEPQKYRLTSAANEGTFELTYAGTIHHQLGDQKEEYTRGFRETQGTVGPQGVYLDGNSAWVPRFNESLIRFSLDVQAPEGWQVISQGNGTSRDQNGRARWDSAGLMEQIYLVGGPLRRYADAAGAVETLVYLHEPDDALARKYLDTTARYLEMYRSLIGPYPYGKFALVENFWETGYGMPSFTLLGPQVIRFPFILHSSYPHEILHNWWGNSVFVDYEGGNWCEGLTAYLADHLVQEQRAAGADYRRNSLQKYRNYVKEGRDFPLTEFRERHSAATEAVGYGKALMMIHMLRRQIGDDAFRSGLVDFFRKNRGKRASYDDLRVAFEKASDTELGPFFRQWTTRAGAPVLEVRNTSVQKSAGAFEVTGELVQTQPDSPYQLQVPVTVATEQGMTHTVVNVDGPHAKLSVTVDSTPTAIFVDPMFDVFRLLDPRETPSSIGQIFGESKILAVLPSRTDSATRKRYEELMKAWMSDSHSIQLINDNELKSLPPDRGVWILGRTNRFAPSLIAGDPSPAVPPLRDSIRLGTESVPYADHSVVVIRRHPQNVEKAVGLLIVEPQAAFAGMARKLPHYGKYSYLAFEGDEPTNVVKGQWGVVDSPLVVNLRSETAPLPDLKPEPRKALADLPPVFSSRTLMEHVRWLSAPEREGRGLGSTGLAQSAQYIARQMEAIGLKPGGDDESWFQHFTVENGPNGKPVAAMNVVGILPGKQSDWTDQSIVVGAHFDHLGFGWPDVRDGAQGRLHPGADDNASGIAVMLELAKNLKAEEGGSRNLVFVAFTAEECGRYGSQFYVAHPVFPAGQIRGMINLDTVGRLFNGKVAIHATGTADEWQHIFRGCGFVTGIPNQNVPGNGEASDQMSFIEKGIPAVQIFTGAHSDYHRPTDTPDKIDAAGLVKVATFVKEAVVYMLEREEPLTVRIEGFKPESASKPASPSQGRRVLFGTVPAFDYQGDGVKIDSLVPKSPAAQAGLKPGDVIVRINGKKIPDLRGFSEFLKTLEPDQTVSVDVVRSGAPTSVKVTVVKR